MPHTILCIDDEPDICDALERVFRRKFRVLKANSAKAGLEFLATEKVTIIICDQRMPNMTGVEFFKESLKTHPDAVRILLTGYADIESVIGAINAGQVYRYVTKPWDPTDLTMAIDQAVDRFELTEEIKKKNISLARANEELKTLDTAKSHFMILVNHELKTPLTSLINYVSLLKDTTLDSDQKKYVSRIEQSTDRLKLLITEVLELVSAETGNIPPKIAKTNLQEIFGVVQSLLEGHVGPKQELNFENTKLKVLADHGLIKNILYRLAMNSIKFGDSDKPITISASQSAENKVEIVVENSGAPIDEKTISHILKPFTLNEDIMKHSAGLGLGLSICQAQLKQQNSQLTFESKKNKVRVSFELPEA